jgi:hypothetical protein
MKSNPDRSQCDAIKRHLESGNEIDPLQALRRFRCFRLASRICELKDRGLNISKRMAVSSEGKRHAVYRLERRKKAA